MANVRRIMHNIFRIIFNKWLMVTFHSIKEESGPKERAAAHIFTALDRMMSRRKLHAQTQLHLYSVHVAQTFSPDGHDDRRYSRPSSLHARVDRCSVATKLALTMLARVEYKNKHRAFRQWKFNCQLVEWRLN